MNIATTMMESTTQSKIIAAFKRQNRCRTEEGDADVTRKIRGTRKDIEQQITEGERADGNHCDSGITFNLCILTCSENQNRGYYGDW